MSTRFSLTQKKNNINNIRLAGACILWMIKYIIRICIFLREIIKKNKKNILNASTNKMKELTYIIFSFN